MALDVSRLHCARCGADTLHRGNRCCHCDSVFGAKVKTDPMQPTEQRLCGHCGREFTCVRCSPVRTCSRSCGQKLRRSRGKDSSSGTG